MGIYVSERENCTCHSIKFSPMYLRSLGLSVCVQPVRRGQICFLKASSAQIYSLTSRGRGIKTQLLCLAVF